jgi:hypothetical protein
MACERPRLHVNAIEHAAFLPTWSFREVHQMEVAISHEATQTHIQTWLRMSSSMAMCGPTLWTAPTGKIVEKELAQDRDGRKNAGHDRLPGCDWLAIQGGRRWARFRREALRRVKELQELLRHVGKYGERHDDGFVAPPIVACLYDHEGCWSTGVWRMRIAVVVQQLTRATASRAG